MARALFIRTLRTHGAQKARVTCATRGAQRVDEYMYAQAGSGCERRALAWSAWTGGGDECVTVSITASFLVMWRGSTLHAMVQVPPTP